METYGTKLIILRGNSGSGKSTVARELREASAAMTSKQKVALVEQDYLRRMVLKEKESEGQDNIALIRQTAVFGLERGYHVILEGILYAGRYAGMLQELMTLCPEHYCYYFDISFDETLKRHASKPNSQDFGEREMRQWYRTRDVLGIDNERIITEESSIQTTVDRILVETGL